MQSKMTENSNIEAAGMSTSTQPSSPPSGVRKNRLAVWDHFDIENATEKKAKCEYCGSLIQYGNGTISTGDGDEVIVDGVMQMVMESGGVMGFR
ncbi:hypothetical protein Ahy_B10g102936 [Arachis hypogaea]|uniref:BED-type domain-containing protein n=1 Tax=Arachis hypogaea TaxID=3818 RepID=A0A444X384_ARAHY|nr:hypothetical protein Ahy_B10g102936 [Arachis hypogaea]